MFPLLLIFAPLVPLSPLCRLRGVFMSALWRLYAQKLLAVISPL